MNNASEEIFTLLFFHWKGLIEFLFLIPLSAFVNNCIMYQLGNNSNVHLPIAQSHIFQNNFFQ